MLTIYNTTVPVTSQEMADRLLNVCKEYGLPYWDDEVAFELTDGGKYFRHYKIDNEFWVGYNNDRREIITESEWMELLKNTEL